MKTTMIGREHSSIIPKFFFFLILYVTPALLFAQGVSIWDFRIPETKYQRLTGSLSGELNKTDFNSTEYNSNSILVHSSSDSKYSNFESALAYTLANYNENNSLEIAATLMGQTSYSKGDGKFASWSGHQLMSRLQTNYNLDISTNIRYSNYIVPDTWHWFVEGSGYYSFNQYFDNNSQSYVDGSYTFDSTFTKINSWNPSFGGGIGYGKLRDGSSIFAVLRIMDKLTEDSMLLRPLTKEEVLQIVDVFARRAEYSYSQDRFVKYFMEDIFGQLQKIGVLKNNAVMPYSVLRAVEVLSEQIEPRLFGWRARLGIQRRYMEEINAIDQSGYNNISSNYMPSYKSSSSRYLWYFHDYVSLALEYGYPLTLNLQLNSSLSAEIPFTDYQRKIGYRYQLSGIYQVGERIDATLFGSVSRTCDLLSTNPFQLIDENEFLRNVQYNAGVSLRFFIENNVTFNVSCGYSELYQDHFAFFSSWSSVNKSPTVSFGVNYRFF